ncbi:hypothetical protein GCM10027299_46580 [Larkinella ripae]
MTTVAQVSVKWQKWPAVLQLYPRDDQNKAEVPIAGVLQSAVYSHASVLVFQNGKRWKYQRVAVTKTGTQSQFQLNPTINAGLYLYKFAVYARTGSDSVLVDTRDNIVCGDVILFNGQSNITAYYPSDYFYRNEYLRTFGNSASATPDTLWHLSNVQEGQNGRIATELQRLIMENYGMPTCLINGGVGGTSLKDHIYRNPANPADPTTLYGRLLYWAQKAGVANRIKAFVWRQGENEAGGGTAEGYEESIRLLYKNWQADFPDVKKFYFAQVNLLANYNTGAAQLRDFQRRTPQIFPRTEAIATVGLSAYDGVHYGPPGQFQFANELFRIIARDFYQSKDVAGISSPNLQKAYYRTKEKQELVLEFEPGASMVWKQDTVVDGTTRDIRDFIYFDYAGVQQGRAIASGSAEGNRVYLKLSKPVSATTITYLPDSYEKPFGGPFLKNSRGMRALTFHKVVIGEPKEPEPAPDTLYAGTLEVASCDTIKGWVGSSNYPDASSISVEILANNTVIGSLKPAEVRADLKNGQRGFRFPTPEALKNGQNQTISVRVKNKAYVLAGSPKTFTCTKEPPILSVPGLEVLNVSVYPNPTQGRISIRLFIPGGKTATLGLTDLTGQRVWERVVVGAGKRHEEVVDIPESMTRMLLVSAEIDGRKAVRKVLMNR